MKEKNKGQDSPNVTALKRMQAEGFPEGVRVVAFDDGQYVASGQTYEEVIAKIYEIRVESGNVIDPKQEGPLVHTIDNEGRSEPLVNRGPRKIRR